MQFVNIQAMSIFSCLQFEDAIGPANYCNLIIAVYQRLLRLYPHLVKHLHVFQLLMRVLHVGEERESRRSEATRLASSQKMGMFNLWRSPLGKVSHPRKMIWQDLKALSAS